MLVACNNKPASELTLSGLDPVKFQTEVNNAKTALYTLKNKAGMEVCITNFGGRIVSVMVPDKNGKMQDVVLGFDSIADYINVPSDFGASIGKSSAIGVLLLILGVTLSILVNRLLRREEE